jgi:ribose 5-phosphate isomerase B
VIFIASDHGGFDYKNKVVNFLKDNGYEVEDLGPNELNPQDDYPDFAIPLAQKVGESDDNKGILLCRNGVGMCLAANNVKGIRCGISWNASHAISSRKDDHTNVLALPADYIHERELLETVEAWVNTSYSEDERHNRRLDKVKKARE